MTRSRYAFTLVEMLVVLGIIAVLAALLLPAAMGAVTRARNAAIAMEVNQLNTAVESYKQEKGDYPPCFRNSSVDVVARHIRRCYPKIAPTEFNAIITTDASGNQVWNTPFFPLDEGESLVFWLSHTTTDPRYPFGLTIPSGTVPTFKKYYEFEETRLFDYDNTTADPDLFPSYRAKYCKDTCYVYIDSRSYDFFTQNFANPAATSPFFAYAEDYLENNQDELLTRPYWSTNPNPAKAGSPTAVLKEKNKPANPTTFQIICAGQDGNFGLTEADENVKLFPTGDYYSKADRDNITNFSGGKRLEDNVKQ